MVPYSGVIPQLSLDGDGRSETEGNRRKGETHSGWKLSGSRLEIASGWEEKF